MALPAAVETPALVISAHGHQRSRLHRRHSKHSTRRPCSTSPAKLRTSPLYYQWQGKGPRPKEKMRNSVSSKVILRTAARSKTLNIGLH